jgi:2-polyprenyl-6-methoxyphenol hydroxylase-like FAD-dependent oxidoreductase
VLPHRGAGANSAIEDAEALGEFLRDVSTGEVPAALERAFRVRFKRATRYQLHSGREGLRGGHQPASMIERDYLGAKEWEASFPEMVLQEGEDAVYMWDD